MTNHYPIRDGSRHTISFFPLLISCSTILIASIYKKSFMFLRTVFVLPLVVMGNFDFSGLLNKIQKSTFDFDRRVEDAKNSEESSIRSIELQERNVDRELQGIREKLGLKASTGTNPSLSFLETRRRHKKHHSDAAATSGSLVASDEDMIRESELNREKAVEEVVRVEDEIGQMPEQLFHTQEKLGQLDQVTTVVDE